MAGKAADALIQSRAPELEIGKHDGFVAQKILTSGDLNYAPYERTFRGLPVVGGDFVVVTDDEGHVLNTSVAQTSEVHDFKLHRRGKGQTTRRRRPECELEPELDAD